MESTEAKLIERNHGDRIARSESAGVEVAVDLVREQDEGSVVKKCCLSHVPVTQELPRWRTAVRSARRIRKTDCTVLSVRRSSSTL
ncbi:hypothetical protein L484_001470 [Morus notabilis]|uniref:Uncharacterized protein n=1 Tax=Morus notabilis TaxID=981085 RepID=W9T2H3_9ROSA|nr:hypothetical protein L484_001470 [Morus notabilis]